MREIAGELASWEASGTPFAIATVVQTWKSSPRQPGAAMAVSATGEVVGSVSGGCVEGAVYELAQQVLETKTPVLETYGVSDDGAHAVGLTCGGILNVLVQPVDGDHFRAIPEVLTAISERRSVAVVSVISEDERLRGEIVVPGSPAEPVIGVLQDSVLQTAAIRKAREMLAEDATGVVQLPVAGPNDDDLVSAFVQSFAAPPLMLVFGAIDFAGAVARIGKFLGYHVVICDARPIFATPERFPQADEVVVKWPHRYLKEIETDDRTVICVLTHDPKFDIPVLELALARPAAYVGAMGSRRTHNDRLERLKQAGVPDEHLDRLSSPIGLDLGSKTPEETAVSIAAEFIMLRNGGNASRLVDGELAIHR